MRLWNRQIRAVAGRRGSPRGRRGWHARKKIPLSWVPLKRLLEPLGAVFARGNKVKSILAALGVVLVALGSLLGCSWSFLVALGTVLGDLGTGLGRSWDGLGRSWGDLG